MNWWNELTKLQKIFASVAIPATAVLIIQFVLQLFGLADGEGTDGADAADADADGIPDFDDGVPDELPGGQDDGIFGDDDFNDGTDVDDGHGGMRLFTLRSVVAFFAVGGWMGVAAVDWNLSDFLAVALAVVAGTIAMYFVAWVVYTFLRMQESGNIRYENAVGKEGEVYLSIPPDGRGKVNVIVQERLCEIDAISKCNRVIMTGEKIVVVDITDDGLLIVEPKEDLHEKELNEQKNVS